MSFASYSSRKIGAKDKVICSDINTNDVGLPYPKEAWIAAHRGRVQVVMLGVGAAFDYHGRAPSWMQSTGFDGCTGWCSEPAGYGAATLTSIQNFIAKATADFLAGRFADKQTYESTLRSVVETMKDCLFPCIPNRSGLTTC